LVRPWSSRGIRPTQDRRLHQHPAFDAALACISSLLRSHAASSFALRQVSGGAGLAGEGMRAHAVEPAGVRAQAVERRTRRARAARRQLASKHASEPPTKLCSLVEAVRASGACLAVDWLARGFACAWPHGTAPLDPHRFLARKPQTARAHSLDSCLRGLSRGDTRLRPPNGSAEQAFVSV